MDGLDSACQAIVDVFIQFKNKCKEYEETKNEELKEQPDLPTGKATMGIAYSHYPCLCLSLQNVFRQHLQCYQIWLQLKRLL